MELNKVYHQDCLEGMQSIPDKSIDMILCDLPYGTTQNKWDSVINLPSLWKQYKRIIKENGAIVLTASQPFTTELISSNKAWFKYDMTWNKSQCTGFLNANRMPLRSHEDIVVFYKKQPVYNPQKTIGKRQLKSTGGKTSNYGKFEYQPHYSEEYFPKSIIDIPQVRVKNGHPTQKPVALFEYLIKTYTNEGETVLDNCMGSFTTAIACINTNRNYIGFEKEEKYFNIGSERVRKHLEEKAKQQPTQLQLIA